MQLPLIWIVAAQDDLAGADLRDQVPNGLGREDERVEIELFEIVARLLFQGDVGIATRGRHQSGMVGTVCVGRQVTTTVGREELQTGKPIERALEDQVREGDGR